MHMNKYHIRTYNVGSSLSYIWTDIDYSKLSSSTSSTSPSPSPLGIPKIRLGSPRFAWDHGTLQLLLHKPNHYSRRSLKISIMVDKMSFVPILGHVLIHSNDSKHASLNMQVGGHRPSKERMCRCNLVAVGRCHRKVHEGANCWRSMKPATPRSAYQVPCMAAAEVVAVVCRAAQNACHDALRCLECLWCKSGHSLASMNIQMNLRMNIISHFFKFYVGNTTYVTYVNYKMLYLQYLHVPSLDHGLKSDAQLPWWHSGRSRKCHKSTEGIASMSRRIWCWTRSRPTVTWLSGDLGEPDEQFPLKWSKLVVNT